MSWQELLLSSELISQASIERMEYRSSPMTLAYGHEDGSNARPNANVVSQKECFFLHAKAHSSGLNLVNATHVFLCEPLINTAIELQCVSPRPTYSCLRSLFRSEGLYF